MLDMCLCFRCGGVGGVGGEWVGGLDHRYYVCVRCESGLSMYCAWWIPVHLRCTQCSILLHLMEICFLTCICL